EDGGVGRRSLEGDRRARQGARVDHDRAVRDERLVPTKAPRIGGIPSRRIRDDDGRTNREAMKRLLFAVLVACKGAESPQAVEVTPADSGEQIFAMLSPDAEAALFATPADAGVVDSGSGRAADPLASSSNVPATASSPMAKGG